MGADCAIRLSSLTRFAQPSQRLRGRFAFSQLPRYGQQHIATIELGAQLRDPDASVSSSAADEGGAAWAGARGEEGAIPLVMTHGFGSGSAMFYRNLEPLARRTRGPVFAVDWLGMGRSSRPDYPVRCARVCACADSIFGTELGRGQGSLLALSRGFLCSLPLLR